MSTSRPRLPGLDILRILCALLIYMRHSITMFGCGYGPGIITVGIKSTTEAVMTLFFMISGFSLFYTTYDEDKESIDDVPRFLVRRLIAILPLYLLIHVLWLFFGSDTPGKWLALTPLETVGLQSMFPTPFGVLHNGGTWFVSCILLAYVAFPAIYGLLVRLNRKMYGVLLVGTLATYLPCVAYAFQMGSLYTNPIYRIVEFALGAAIAAWLMETEWLTAGHNGAKYGLALLAALVMVGYVCLLQADWEPYLLGVPGLLYVQPLVYILVLVAAGLLPGWREGTMQKILVYASGLTYGFFLLQTYLWQLSAKVMAWITGLVEPGAWTNETKILVSFGLCVALAVLSKECFEKPIGRYLKGKLKAKEA